jgi:hypothetical protein
MIEPKKTDLADSSNHDTRAATTPDAHGPSDQIVTVGWTADRTPTLPKRQARDDDDVAALWPKWTKTAKPLSPKPGAVRSVLPVLIVTLFDVTEAQIRQAVRRIVRQHKSARNCTPVFITNSLETTAIRQAGYTFEYVSPDVFCAPAQSARFGDRFAELWRKWGGASLIDFSANGFLARRIENLDFYISRTDKIENHFNPRKSLLAPPRPIPTDIAALRAEYRATGLDAIDDTFVLYRIIGNDLPPRHEVGQTLRNLTFILENEPKLARCEKRWVINRIVDPEQEALLIALLERFKQPYLHIPFDLEEYSHAGWNVEGFPDDAFFLRGRYHRMAPYEQQRAQAHARRFKNNYVIHNNGARNAALRDGKDRAKWVLPWDGNCFLTAAAWDEISENVIARPYLKYFTVPMARILDNADLLDPAFRPEAEEEPQLIFRTDSGEEFDETFYYGRRPKVELFYRLGICGKWDTWPDDVWDHPRADRSGDAGTTGQAGWVARLFSGKAELELDKPAGQPSGLLARGEARIAAISDMLDKLDIKAAKRIFRPETLTVYDEAEIAALAQAEPETTESRYFVRLKYEADLALQRGPYSVTDKTATPPSGDAHDYYNPAPYWWPNPTTPNGMPYIFRDGVRILGTRIYEIESDAYDRTRLQRLFDDTTTLALAWVGTENDAYIAHAATLVRTWFLDPKTRMNPHLLYAQIRSQTPQDHGSKSGLIEMKDLYYFLDAVRIVERAGALNDGERQGLRDWLRDYLEWLQTSEQGIAERLSPNNHGTCYDLQTGAIAAFLGDIELLQATFRTSRERMLEQFTPAGQQPHEMKRTQTAHYCCFNLQAWVNLANLAEACGDRLWSFEASDGRGLATVFGWILPRLAKPVWEHQQIEPFDRSRFLPLFFAARERAALFGGTRLADASQTKPLFFPHDGINPFWMLARPVRDKGHSANWQNLGRKLQKLEPAASEMMGYLVSPNTESTDIRDLDKKLWGGFSGPALQGLADICDNQTSNQQDINRASRSLARWYFTAGDYANALSCAARMDLLGAADERERQLIEGYCFDRLGDNTMGRVKLNKVRAVFPKDPSLALASANLLVQDAQIDMSHLAQSLGRIYKDAFLPALSLGPHNAGSEDHASAPKIARMSVDPHIVAAHCVSVIVPVGPDATQLESALSSLRSQTWSNLEILVTSASRGAKQKAKISTLAALDPRIRIIPVKTGAPEYQARNTALKEAKGTFVTVHQANEVSHPVRIAEQIMPLLRDYAIATVSRCVSVSAEGRFEGVWSPDFTLVFDSPTSLMAATDILREAGGWDAVATNPDAYLAWRLRKSLGKDCIQTVLPRIPAALIWQADVARGPAHLMFPYGQRRDDLRRLVRLTSLAADANVSNGITIHAPLRASAKPKSLSTVFIGDFSHGAPAIEAISAHIADSANSGANVGLFHWPDHHNSWREKLDEGLSEMVETGRIHHVSGDDQIPATEIVLCNPYVIAHRIDGLPDFQNDRLIVLGGPELNVAEFYDDRVRTLPTLQDISTIFGQQAILRSL